MKKVLIFILLLSGIASFAQTVGEIAKINLQRVSARTGQAGQTASGQNILLGTAGTGSFDLTGTSDSLTYNWISLQITVSGTVSSGVVTYEGSNDNVAFSSVYLFQASNVGISPTSHSATTTITQTSARWMYGHIPFRYFRARISTVVGGGGSIGCSYILASNLNPVVSLVTYPSPPIINPNGQFGNSTSASSINPLLMGSRVGTTHPTNDLVAGDGAYYLIDINNKQVVRPYALGQVTWAYAAATSGISNTTTAVTIKAAGAAGVRNCITGIDIATNTLGASTELAIRDGAAGTVLWRGFLNTTALPIMHIAFPVPLRGTAATLLEVVTLTAVTGNVYVNFNGFEEY